MPCGTLWCRLRPRPTRFPDEPFALRSCAQSIFWALLDLGQTDCICALDSFSLKTTSFHLVQPAPDLSSLLATHVAPVAAAIRPASGRTKHTDTSKKKVHRVVGRPTRSAPTCPTRRSTRRDTGCRMMVRMSGWVCGIRSKQAGQSDESDQTRTDSLGHNQSDLLGP